MDKYSCLVKCQTADNCVETAEWINSFAWLKVKLQTTVRRPQNSCLVAGQTADNWVETADNWLETADSRMEKNSWMKVNQSA